MYISVLPPMGFANYITNNNNNDTNSTVVIATI